MRIKKIICSALLVSCMVFAMTACGSKKAAKTGGDAKSGNITVGFSQVGAESDWRTANSTSMKETMHSRSRRIKSKQSETSSSRRLITSYLLR